MYTPIVMPRSKKYGNNYWNSRGPKVGMREVILYSDLEFDHWLHIETDPEVVTYCEQFKEIQFVTEDGLHSTIFDMWIKYRDGRQVVHEVKYSSELNPNDSRNARALRQIEAQNMWCFENGIQYKVVTEKTIRSSLKELENKITMVSFIKSHTNYQPILDLCLLLTTHPSKLADLSQQLDIPFRVVRDECLWLLYKGHINANLKQILLGKQTEVWIDEPSKTN